VPASEAEHTSVEGSCLCGENRYRVSGECTGMVHCHCQRCRKSHGASLVSWTHFRKASFVWLRRGELGHYDSSAQTRRSFCLSCGSNVPDPDSTRDQFGFPVGNVLQMARPHPTFHFYTASRAPWTDIAEDVPQFEVVPEHFRDPGMADFNRSTTTGRVSGSCLCGRVTFEAANPEYMMHCHCSRCRLSRAAPHATNLFVPRESLHWTSGTELVRSYKLPDAERFAVGFCHECGGLVPRTNSNSKLTNIPAGSLDSDPGIKPSGHIFVGSKAAWFDIADALPQWQTYPR